LSAFRILNIMKYGCAFLQHTIRIFKSLGLNSCIKYQLFAGKFVGTNTVRTNMSKILYDVVISC